MNVKKSAVIFLGLAIISFCTGVGVVAYKWGYMQSMIDNRVATFSFPASIAMLDAIPFIVAMLVFMSIAFVISKKNKSCEHNRNVICEITTQG